MINRLDNDLQFHQTALNLRAARQEVLASNIANADTPHFKARDIDFKAALNGALGRAVAGQPPLALARTSAQHLDKAAGGAAANLLYRTELQSSVDGNTVDMDTERAAFAENAIQFEAMLTFINGKLKTMSAAIQP